MMLATPMSTPLATAIFRCSLCNETAGTVELLPPGHPEGLSKDTSTIFLKDFIGTEQVVVSAAASPRVQAALDKFYSAALYQTELRWVPLYCPTCARVYCRKHWVILPE